MRDAPARFAARSSFRCVPSNRPTLSGRADHVALPGRASSAIHIGLPGELGIADLGRPDYGDVVPVAADELPVFWACGVTPQAGLASARLPLAITHSPGCMFVSDVRDESLATF